MPTQSAVIAAVAARAPGSYKTPSRPLPPGDYLDITIQLLNGAGGTNFAGDAGFVDGDVIDGQIDTSEDGGQTWTTIWAGKFLGGHPSPRTGGFSTGLPYKAGPNARYRAGAVVTSGNPTVTFGVNALLTT